MYVPDLVCGVVRGQKILIRHRPYQLSNAERQLYRISPLNPRAHPRATICLPTWTDHFFGNSPALAGSQGGDGHPIDPAGGRRYSAELDEKLRREVFGNRNARQRGRATGVGNEFDAETITFAGQGQRSSR